ncbi:MAG: metallophosphoesterase [Prolixibacteraceae bacterium]|jgi:3',5'-cyclic AMP phosphodiesterase CpdA|nr:metallophosphoesterase [Prolixibacteraceae bacterium]
MKLKIIFFILFALQIETIFSQNLESHYSFAVAGHAYGSHSGSNIGLHQPLINRLTTKRDSLIDFIVFTGDIVNQSTNASWNQVESDLELIGLPSYFVMGNHDQNTIGYSVFTEKHGGTYYSFKRENELFVVLNSTQEQRSISREQIIFLENELVKSDSSIHSIFIFFHEILWNSHEKYKDVLSNSRSRFNNILNYSNYWTDIHSLLIENGKDIYIIAGDVAGNEDAIPAFYDQWDNVHLIASGMGEVEEENYLKVNINSDSVSFELIPLRDEIVLKELSYYSLPAQPDSIYGLELIEPNTSKSYEIDAITNASSYEWALTDYMNGSSNSILIVVDFNEEFLSGEIAVRSVHHGFGKSKWRIRNVAVEEGNLNSQYLNNLDCKITWQQLDGQIEIKFNMQLSKPTRVQFIDMNGHLIEVDQNQIITDNNNTIRLNTSKYKAGVYTLLIENNQCLLQSKILLN